MFASIVEGEHKKKGEKLTAFDDFVANPTVANRTRAEDELKPGMDSEIDYIIHMRTPEQNQGFKDAIDKMETAQKEASDAWEMYHEGKLPSQQAWDKTNIAKELKQIVDRHKNRTAQILELRTCPEPPEWEGDTLGACVKTHSYAPNTLEWLQERVHNMGGSDVGSLYRYLYLPGEPWVEKNMAELIQNKHSFPEECVPSSINHQPHFWRGNVWEGHILNQFLREHPEIKAWHTKAQWKFGDFQQINLDGLMDDGIIEIKTSAASEEWADGKIPVGYRAQMLYYLATLNGNNPVNAKYHHAWIACKIHDSENLTVRHITHDEPISPGGPNMYEFLPEVEKFWQENEEFWSRQKSGTGIQDTGFDFNKITKDAEPQPEMSDVSPALLRGRTEERQRLSAKSFASLTEIPLRESADAFVEKMEAKNKLEEYDKQTIAMIDQSLPPQHYGGVGKAAAGYAPVSEKVATAALYGYSSLSDDILIAAKVKKKEPFVANFATDKSTAWKPEIYREYSRQTGRQVNIVKGGVNRDGYSAWIEAVSGDRLLYTSTTEIPIDEIPDRFLKKARWGLFVTGLREADVAIAVQDSEVKIFVVTAGNVDVGKLEQLKEEIRLAKEGKYVSPVSMEKRNQSAAFETFEALTGDAIPTGNLELSGLEYNPEGWIVVDLETTSIIPQEGDVIELAYQKMDRFGEVAEEGSFLYSPNPKKAVYTGTGPENVHNISMDMLADKPTFLDSTDQLMEIFASAPIVIAHYAPFEKSWLEPAFGIKMRWLDTREVCKFYCETERNTLKAFAEHNGVSYEGAHRALADVDMTRRALNNFARNGGMRIAGK